MAPQCPNIEKIDWKRVAQDVQRHASAFSRQKGWNYDDCLFAAWYAVEKAYKLFDANHKTGAKFSTYYTRAIYRWMNKDWRSYATVVSRPQDKRADGKDIVSNAEIEELNNVAAESNEALFDEDGYSALARLLAALKPMHREILELRMLQGLSFVEIAKQLGIERRTAHLRYKCALKRAQQLRPAFIK